MGSQRRQALRAYLLTIADELKEVREPDEYVARVIDCVREDVRFLAADFIARSADKVSGVVRAFKRALR